MEDLRFNGRRKEVPLWRHAGERTRGAGRAEPGDAQTYADIRREGERLQVSHRGRGDEARPGGTNTMREQVRIDCRRHGGICLGLARGGAADFSDQRHP